MGCVNGCGRPVKIKSTGECTACYQRRRRHERGAQDRVGIVGQNQADPAKLAHWQAVHAELGETGLAELFTERLDTLAGPYALTDTERSIQKACRAVFGRYDPALHYQQVFISQHQRRLTQPAAA